MAIIEVDLLTDQGNNAVLKLPGRKYPGVLLQGDTLNTLLSVISEAMEAMERNDATEARDVLSGLSTELREARDRYEAALRGRGIELPY
jgi:hypothetical protein